MDVMINPNSIKNYPLKSIYIINKLEYWFRFKISGFYKFLEPCNHRAYKKGDSWSEELGFCRKTFNAAFDLIGIRYKSKTAFLAAEDKFKGKFYASYYDRDTNQMFYVRNHEFVEQLLQSFKKKKIKLSYCQNTKPQESKNHELSDPKFPVRTGRNFRSDGGIIGGYINIPTSNNQNTALLDPVSSNQNNDLDKMKEIGEEMKKIWLEEIGDFGTKNVSTSLTKQLALILNKFFDNSLEKWRNYCCLIASSKFLMGELKTKTFKRVWINWAITEEFIEKVKAGEFGIGDRKTRIDKELEQKWVDYQSLAARKKELEEQKQDLDRSLSQKRFQASTQHLAKMTPKENEEMNQQFEQEWLITIEKDPQKEPYKKTYRDSFNRQYVLKAFGGLSAEEDLKKALDEQGISDELEQVENKLREFDTSIFEKKQSLQNVRIEEAA